MKYSPLLLVLIAVILQSCSGNSMISKRVHRKGYYIDLFSTKPVAQKENSVLRSFFSPEVEKENADPLPVEEDHVDTLPLAASATTFTSLDTPEPLIPVAVNESKPAVTADLNVFEYTGRIKNLADQKDPVFVKHNELRTSGSPVEAAWMYLLAVLGAMIFLVTRNFPSRLRR